MILMDDGNNEFMHRYPKVGKVSTLLSESPSGWILEDTIATTSHAMEHFSLPEHRSSAYCSIHAFVLMTGFVPG